MDVLQNVRLAEKEWARRFSGRREMPSLGLRRRWYDNNMLLRQLVCVRGALGSALGSLLQSASGRILRTAGSRPQRSPLATGCSYRE